ncbi:MAG: mitochondrial fission ELM1 family protein [Deltaproteobacteria bacterium]|nr:mitochondrial fission ELM1 family protein [Deltaproteobacteria bacterium]
MKNNRFLIISDGKPGHVNQAIAFAQHLDLSYDLVPVTFNSRINKGFSYIADFLGYFSTTLFSVQIPPNQYAAIVSAGSETYYANKTLSKQMGCKSIAIMLPKGYRLDFDLIVAQQHDNPPQKPNIISVPINLTYPQPQDIVVPEAGKSYVGIVVGGDSAHQKMDGTLLERQLKKIFELFPEHKVWVTTSRRTTVEIEAMLTKYNFDRAVFFAKEPINPIPDFLKHCEYVFITADSSSMISEAVSFGAACIEILPLEQKQGQRGKIGKFINKLEMEGYLHQFDGKIGRAAKKINLFNLLNGINL